MKYLFLLIILFPSASYSSPWGRAKDEGFLILEQESESNSSSNVIGNFDEEIGYQTRTSKIYFEYGLNDNFTLTGFAKKMQVQTVEKDELNSQKIEYDINNDKYGGLSLIQNLYRNNDNVFSIQYGYKEPVKTSEYSKRLNYFESHKSYSLSAMAGYNFAKNSEFQYYMNNSYFATAEFGVKLGEGTFYDEAIFTAIAGIKGNINSMLMLRYDLNYDFYSNTFFTKVRKGNSNKNTANIEGLRAKDNYYLSSTNHKIKLSLLTRFTDHSLVEIGIHKVIASQTESEGISLAIWIDNF